MFASAIFHRGPSTNRASRARARHRSSRPTIELMEDRCVPALIMVTSLADGPGDANLVTPTAQGFIAPSLRAAISFANSNNGTADVIELMTPGVYQISRPNVGGIGEDLNQTGDFDILAAGGDLTITNQSGGPVTISGGGLDRVFDINPNVNFNANSPTPKFTVTLQDLTITGGYAFSPAFTDGNGAPGSGNNTTDVSGGGIRDSFNASLTLKNVVVTGNVAQAAGGGISMENPLGFSTPWTLNVQNSTISNNRAGDAGGGINTKGSGRVAITQSVISGNVCVNQGAGIWLDTIDVGAVHQSAELSVIQSVISGNVGLAADQFGGGIGNAGNDTLAAGQASLPGDVQAVLILNSTLSNNVTGGSGGGYGDENGQGTLFVLNSTFADNSANVGGGIQADGPATTILQSTVTGNSAQTSGGGVVVPVGTFILNNTIVAGNFAGPTNFLGGTAPDIMATVTTGTGNLIGINDGSLTVTAGSSNQVGTPTNPIHVQLGPLQNNGGPLAGAPNVVQTVFTKAPLSGSPAIDRGVNVVSFGTTDERGLLRIVNGTQDVGAVEFQPPTTMTLLTISGTVRNNQPLTFTATVNALVTGNPVTGTVTFSLDGVALGTANIVNGSASLTVTPTTATFKPGNHSLTATYNGDVNFTGSTATQTVTAPIPPVLTTTLTRKRGRFTLQVLNNGQLLQTFTLTSQPNIQRRDLNGDGITDLVISLRKGRKLVVFAAFSGADASRIV